MHADKDEQKDISHSTNESPSKGGFRTLVVCTGGVSVAKATPSMVPGFLGRKIGKKELDSCSASRAN